MKEMRWTKLMDKITNQKHFTGLTLEVDIAYKLKKSWKVPGIVQLIYQIRLSMPTYADFTQFQKEVVDKMNARHAMFKDWLIKKDVGGAAQR